MTFLPGHGSKVFVNGVAVCSTVSSWAATHSRAVSEVTAMCQGVNGTASYVPGLKSGSLAMNGPVDTVGQNLDVQVVASIGQDNTFVATLLPGGDTVGQPALFGVFDPNAYSIDASVAEAVTFSFGAAADESIEMGYVLHAEGAETADANGTAVDRSVTYTSTVLGLAAGLHVTAYTGFTSVAFKIQHSTDNSIWADLVSFASVTAVGGQIVKTAADATVNRYLRVVTDVTGTGSVTFLATAAPR